MNSAQMPDRFFHGSYDNFFEEGAVITPRPETYEENWASADFYQVLEHYRPDGMIAHKDAVFMVGDEDDIDLAGGATDVVYEVEPVGDVQMHDLNWSSEISCLLSEPDIDFKTSEKIQQAALAYFEGKPHPNESVWEYLAPAMKITQKLYDDSLTP